MFNLNLSQTQAFASILAGRDIDALIAEETVADLVAAHEEGKLLADTTPKATAPVAAQDDYDAMTDAEARAALVMKTGGFVSPNMTTDQVKAKLRMLQAEAQEQSKPKAKSTAPKTQRLGVGKRQVELLKSGKTVDETLAIILEEFPTAKTTKACVSWYKSKIAAGLY